MITLHLRYIIDPNKLPAFRAYTEAEQGPIAACGGTVVGYYLPTDFAGTTNEAVGIIDFASLAAYEVYRGVLAAHPEHQRNKRALEESGALLSTVRSLIERVEPREVQP